MEAYKRKEIIGDSVLYLGDCLDILPTLGKVDVVVTDPPYGVGKKRSGIRKGKQIKSDYNTDAFVDCPEYVLEVCVSAIQHCINRQIRTVLTPGYLNIYKYPEPNHVGTFQYPSSCSMSCWGPALWQPILYYGKDPHQGRLVPDSKPNCNDRSEDVGHPCPKPIKQWLWMVKRASLKDEIALDPFMGSGTTGVACAKLGRKFIGIELDETYFEIPCERIQKAYDQPDLFVEPPTPQVQEDMEI